MTGRDMKRSSLLALLSGLLLVACGGLSDSSTTSADTAVGTTEAGVCADGTCTCVAPDCDALNWTACGKGGGTTMCSTYDGTTCRTGTCACSSSGKWICP